MNIFIEKIKFSNLRTYYKIIKFKIKKILSLIFNVNYLWNNKFQNFSHPNNKILIFAPSMNLDKTSYLNVGLRLLIEKAKKLNIETQIIQCVSGLDICHLGGSPFTDRVKMPCESCSVVNRSLYKDLNIIKFESISKFSELNKLSFDQLKNFNYKDINIGQLSITSIAWILRTPEVNSGHINYLRKSISSGIKLVDFLENQDLKFFSGVLVFNGLTMPEAIMYQWCKINNLNVATFESGWSIKNEYALEINYKPSPQHFFDFENRKLTESENKALLNYMDVKKAKFESFKIDDNRKIISIFGNVSWDTTQIVSSKLFESMFNWLDSLIPIIQKHPEYLFIFRAHPGENRNLKETWYGLENWFELNQDKLNNNSICFSANNKVNSYEIIKESELVLVYNSTIGIESAILGKRVLAAALTHYSDIGFVDSFKNKFQYLKELEQTLVGSKFETEIINTQQAKSYYYQLLNDVAYNFGAINIELPFNEHTILRDFELQSEKVDDLSNAINSFLYKKPLEKKFNL